MDLPVVRPVFEAYARAKGVDKRLRFHPGDFFKDPLPKTDVLIMGHILHDWDMAEKRTLLDKAHRALPDGGALIVYEALIDDARRENAFGLLMSLNMLIEFGDAFDYTGGDFARWCEEAGFERVEILPLVGPVSAGIAHKAA